jgi:Cys-tRNA synthase (O-phospho-L-seryl-tRNA:Cys-tRNA synthase)
MAEIKPAEISAILRETSRRFLNLNCYARVGTITSEIRNALYFAGALMSSIRKLVELKMV